MRFIRMKQVMEMTSLSRSSINRYIKEERFPRCVPLGCRAAVWLENEVQDWMRDILGRRDENALYGYDID